MTHPSRKQIDEIFEALNYKELPACPFNKKRTCFAKQFKKLLY